MAPRRFLRCGRPPQVIPFRVSILPHTPEGATRGEGVCARARQKRVHTPCALTRGQPTLPQ